LIAECRTLGGCATGDAKVTRGYRLPARHVIHTVGPIGEKPALLASAYRRSLDVAATHGCRSVAFPCISTGVYGYPQGRAALLALTTVRAWLDVPSNAAAIDRVVFTCFLGEDLAMYDLLLPAVFPMAYAPLPAAAAGAAAPAAAAAAAPAAAPAGGAGGISAAGPHAAGGAGGVGAGATAAATQREQPCADSDVGKAAASKV
jgi:hypothetical protein